MTAIELGELLLEAVVLTNGIRREQLDWCSCRKDTLTLLDIVLCAEALGFLA